MVLGRFKGGSELVPRRFQGGFEGGSEAVPGRFRGNSGEVLGWFWGGRGEGGWVVGRVVGKEGVRGQGGKKGREEGSPGFVRDHPHTKCPHWRGQCRFQGTV